VERTYNLVQWNGTEPFSTLFTLTNHSPLFDYVELASCCPSWRWEIRSLFFSRHADGRYV